MRMLSSVARYASGVIHTHSHTRVFRGWTVRWVWGTSEVGNELSEVRTLGQGS